jgi:hypothetical protein
MMPPLILSFVLLMACNGGTEDSGTSATDTGEPPVGCTGKAGCLIAQDLSAGLMSVRVVADDDVWIVGASPDNGDGTGPVVLHYDGSAFERLDTSAWDGGEIWWTWVSADEAVFVGLEGLILEMSRSDGVITQIEGPDSGTTFFGVWGASGDDLWAVGQTENAEGPPALWRRTAGSWAAWEDPDLGPGEDRQVYFKVHGTAADDVWIVGTNGKSLHWDGTSLTTVATDAETNTDTAPLLTIDAGGERPIAVGGAGNGLVLEYDGSDWLNLSPDFEPGYNGVCTGAGAAWAVGVRGVRARRESDGSWTSDRERGVDSWISRDWHGCAISPNGGIWTVGGRIAARPLKEGAIGYQGPDEPPEVVLD